MSIVHAKMPEATTNMRYSEYLRTSFSILQQLVRSGSTALPSSGVSSTGSMSRAVA